MSKVSKAGKPTTTAAETRSLKRKEWFKLTPLPKMARTGTTRRKTTTELPMRLPTKISGWLLMTALMPTMISVREVNKPKIKKDTKNEDILNEWEILETAETARPEPIQRRTKETVKRVRLISILIDCNGKRREGLGWREIWGGVGEVC